jgi:hypothetical protein
MIVSSHAFYFGVALSTSSTWQHLATLTLLVCFSTYLAERIWLLLLSEVEDDCEEEEAMVTVG